MIKHTVKKMFLATGLCALGLLAACGGGGGSAGTSVFDNSASMPTSGAPVANDLVVTLSKPSIENTGSDSVAVTVTAVDANRQVIASAPALIRVDSDAIITTTSTATDTTGRLIGQLSVGANRANRLITVTAVSGSISKTVFVSVVGAKLQSTAVSAGASGDVTFVLSDPLNARIPDQPIQISAPLLTPSTISGVTDINGEYVYTYTSASTSGAANITATAGGASVTQVVQVGTSTVPDAVGTVPVPAVQVNPSVVGTNPAGITSSRSEVRVIFIAPGNIPVENVRVRLDLAGNVNNIPGSFSSGANIIYSNANGVATTSYIPGARSSPVNGVTVRACYAATNLALANGACPAFATQTLTVTSEPLTVTIGTDGTIEKLVASLSYRKRFVAKVVDSGGRALAGVTITPSIKLIQYGKGVYTSGVRWARDPAATLFCPAEDVSGEGFLDPGEDLDHDDRLEPRPSEVSVLPRTVVTREDGTAEIYIEYPQNFATWINANITVAANGVSGTEGRDTYRAHPLPAPIEDVTGTATPAFWLSPYGMNIGNGLPTGAGSGCLLPN